MEVIEWDPPRRCVVAHLGRVVRGDGVFEVTELGPAPVPVRLVPSGWSCRWARSARLGWPLVRPAFRSGVRHVAAPAGPALRGPAPGRVAGATVTAERSRCGWATSAPEYVAYHDDEWGRPLHGVRPRCSSG